jgi:flavorubredoxin/NADPH-dependent 2,4-dienoyl-CoA reductase/sulfur reductase-like enzyme/rubredoxin
LAATEIKPNVFWIGALDPDLRIFDVIMETNFGTSYNAYLVKGQEKTVLLETVKEKFFDQYLKNLKEAADPSQIDYLIMNHTEPDHSGSIARLLQLNPNLTIIGSQTALTFLQAIVNRPFNAREVRDGDTLDLGGTQLQFISAPFLHWPDSMYTYVPEQKILFTCDSFGAHYSDERLFNDLIPGDFEEAYKYYFDMILSPFKGYMREALDKIAGLELDCICPGHGPILRQNLDYYLDLYRQWSAEEPRTSEYKKIVVCYVSAYGYTASLAKAIIEGLETVGEFEVESFDLVDTPVAEALKSINQADGLLIGSPTINGDALPPIWELLTHLSPITHAGKMAAAFGAYGWSGEAVPNIESRLRSLRMNVEQRGLKVNFKPSDSDLEEAFMFGYTFGKNLLEAIKDPAGRRWRCSVCGHVFIGEEPPGVCPACGVKADHFDLVSEEEVDFESTSPLRIVVIGSGAAALAAIEAIRLRNQACSIKLITADSALPYFRPSLIDLLSGELDDAEFYLHPADWYAEQKVDLLLGTTVESIDPKARLVYPAQGEAIPYDRLIMATGSHSTVPDIPGSTKVGSFTLRSLDDCRQIKEWAKTAQQAVVVGGGLLGLEAAWAFKKAGLKVTIIENDSRLLPLQLDSTGSALLEDAVTQAGVTICHEASTAEILGDEKVEGVRLTSGQTVPADLVFFAMGITPNTGLAKAAGIEVNLGIVVNQNMQTSEPGILAAGDVAEYDGKVYGLWSIALEQGRIAGANATNDGQTYKPQIPNIYLTAFDTNVFAAGDPGLKDAEYNTVEVREPENKVYKKYYLKDGALEGVVLVGPKVKATSVIRRLEAGARRLPKADRWKCLRCGYIHEGPEPPDICPLCGAPKSLFVPA